LQGGELTLHRGHDLRHPALHAAHEPGQLDLFLVFFLSTEAVSAGFGVGTAPALIRLRLGVPRHRPPPGFPSGRVQDALVPTRLPVGLSLTVVRLGVGVDRKRVLIRLHQRIGLGAGRVLGEVRHEGALVHRLPLLGPDHIGLGLGLLGLRRRRGRLDDLIGVLGELVSGDGSLEIRGVGGARHRRGSAAARAPELFGDHVFEADKSGQDRRKDEKAPVGFHALRGSSDVSLARNAPDRDY